jgi:hypothetical protein
VTRKGNVVNSGQGAGRCGTVGVLGLNWSGIGQADCWEGGKEEAVGTSNAGIKSLRATLPVDIFFTGDFNF